MSRRVTVRQLAEADISQAVIWYEGQRVGLGREFLAELRSMVRTIGERPESFPVDYRGARRALLRRFPYKVYFTVSPGGIFVIAVIHSRRSKRGLRGRL